MANADELLLQAFRELGALQEPHPTLRVAELSGAQLSQCVASALRALGQLTRHSALADAPAQRLRQCRELAAGVREAGFPAECSYHDLLYPSERSSRQILMWLAERLGKAEGTLGLGAATGPPQVAQKLKPWVARTWTVLGGSCAPCTPFETYAIGLGPPGEPPARLRGRRRQRALGPSLLEQFQLLEAHEAAGKLSIGPRERDVAARVKRALELQPVQNGGDWHARGGRATVHIQVPRGAAPEAGSFARRERFGAEHESPQRLDEDEELARLAAEIAEVKKQRNAAVSEARAALDRIDAAREGLRQAADAKLLLAREYKVQRKVGDLLPEAASNLVRLQESLETIQERRVQLEADWEAHRGPLEARAAQAEAEAEAARRRRARALQESRRLQGELHDMREQILSQESVGAALEAALAKAPASAGRDVYTRRILDAIRQLRKQEAEIGRVIEDIRRVRQEINQRAEQLTRAEAVTDELVFRAAEEQRNDPTGAQVYRSLHDMRTLFDQLIEAAEEVGKTENRARDLGARCAALGARVSGSSARQLERDLEHIREENVRLEERQRAL